MRVSITLPGRFIICLLLIFLAALPSVAPAIQGDVTSDGIISLSDAVLVQQYLEGQAVLDADALARADMNNDGVVDIADVVAICFAASAGASLPVAMIPVPEGTFPMGPRDDEVGNTDEYPTHTVTLSAYLIGKYAVTNGQYCDVLNWALARGYVKDFLGGTYSGGDVGWRHALDLWLSERHDLNRTVQL
ncbi:MAG: SUMF1/EgtB/PvdO family nonheme iron enzyme [Candidatus Sumerlaeota bacterium]|nr:SUMF1/EgtB/PvdO family nonheme iron enzyme [Candidatus Sumerlaeota bacterium]